MIKKIIIVIPLIVLGMILFLALFISRYGKDILSGQIEKKLRLETTLESARFNPPLGLNLKKLQVGGLFAAEEISFSINPLGLLAGKIIVDGLTINNALITLEQSSEGKLNLPQLGEKSKKLNIIPTGIRLKNAKFIFTDKKITPEGLKTIVDDLDFSLLKANPLAFSLRANYSLAGVFKDENSRRLGDLEGQGWLDLTSKDMDGYIEIKGLDLVYFKPYYGDFVSQRKLLSVNLNLKSDLRSKNNDLSVLCHLELFNLSYASSEGSDKKPDIFSNALDLFSDEQGRINLDFTLRTKLDKPVFNASKFKSVITKAAGRNLANQSPDKIIDKVGSAIEQFREMFKKP